MSEHNGKVQLMPKEKERNSKTGLIEFWYITRVPLDDREKIMKKFDNLLEIK